MRKQADLYHDPLSRSSLVMLAVVACAETRVSPAGQQPTRTASESRSSPIFEDLETGWTKLPRPPEVRRGTAATVWTGEQLLVWGGYVYTGFSDEVPQSTGFAFDARSRRWEPITASRLPPGSCRHRRG
jgi:hypothetical protein